jgi:molybdenum cofactor cytidylyltransferase
LFPSVEVLMASVVSVVIASQPGEGFVSSRWTARWGGTTLLGHVLAEVRKWPVAPGLVILGADAEEVLDTVDLEGFTVLIDPDWHDGEESSLQAGLDYLQREDAIDAIVLASGDMPLIPAGTVDALLAADGGPGSPPAIVPKYRYARGRPVLIRRELWPRLLGLGATASVEAMLATHGALVTDVWIDHLPPPVVAHREDLEGLAPRR